MPPHTPSPSPPDVESLERLLLELHAAAAAETLPRFRSGLEVENKEARSGGFDPVTAADRGAEAAIRKLLAERRPDDGVIGEEYGADRPDAEFVWVLDPVDGTRAFISGLPLWTTLIGLRWRGRPTLGSIGQPYLDEVFTGHAGGSKLVRRGAETPLRVRSCPHLTGATLASTDPHAYFTGAELGAWNQVRAAARLTRLGGDGYLFALVAAGGIDLVVETALKPWDIEPCLPVIEGAGGRVTNWRGETLDGTGQVLACGDPAVLDEALVSLRRSAL